MNANRLPRDTDGTLPSYAWPGGYPLYYRCADGGCLCPDCANGHNDSSASTDPDTADDWRIVAGDVHWEGPAMTCDHCGADIESAYGDPDADPTEPSDDDATMSPCGPLGSQTAAAFGGKSLGVFDSDDDAEAAIRAAGRASGFYPNVWRISDHGNAHLVTNWVW